MFRLDEVDSGTSVRYDQNSNAMCPAGDVRRRTTCVHGDDQERGSVCIIQGSICPCRLVGNNRFNLDGQVSVLEGGIEGLVDAVVYIITERD